MSELGPNAFGEPVDPGRVDCYLALALPPDDEEDGRGGVLGAGLTYDLIERHVDTQPWTLSFVYRRTWTDQGPRHDVAFDVAVPLGMFFGTRIQPEDPSDRSVSNRRGNPGSWAR